MKFYLSSYEIGNYGNDLANMFPHNNKKVGYICNALDFPEPNREQRNVRIQNDMNNLTQLGLKPEIIDLKEYFCDENIGKGLRQQIPTDDFKNTLSTLGGVFLSGGNTFILRQAFYLSGFDTWIAENMNTDFVYAGYSAACCILTPSLKNLQIVDNPKLFPYPQIQNTLWDGLGILSYSFLPHYNSDHHESADIDKEIEYAIQHKIPFVAYRDGEVLQFDTNEKKGIYAFLDMQNIHLGTEDMGWRVDWGKFYIYLKNKYKVDKIFVFMGYIRKNKKFYNKLEQIGYTLIFKETVIGKDGKMKGNVDTELTVEAMKREGEYRKGILISGDGDFLCVINRWRSLKKEIEIISASPKSCSFLLRKYSHGNLSFLSDYISKINKASSKKE